MGRAYSLASKTFAATAACSIAANLVLKQQAINQLHDPSCCRGGVIFGDLGSSGLVSRFPANAYHISMFAFMGSILGLIVAEYLRGRR
jgi:hypothetical protein